ncbi:MAG: hypothetical protein JO151_16480 [Verrucomicrobia bacterium]|nr:hypothetical protein [Verrucomicrobiota bacterium]
MNLFVLAALGNDLNVADDVLVELVQLVYPARFVFRKTNALIRALTRILERQKMLQTGQVLLRRLCVDFALVLPFKDSSEAAEPRCSTPIAIKLPDTPRRSEAPPR